MTTRANPMDRMHKLLTEFERVAEAFNADHDETIERYRDQIRRGLDDALSQMRSELDTVSGGNATVAMIAEETSDYASWMQWSLWDLPVFAVAIEPDLDDFRDAVTACGLVYIAIRLFDDVIDHHYVYKGRRNTLLGTLGTTYSDATKVSGLSTLAALLLCFEGLGRLAGGSQGTTSERLTTVVTSMRRAVIGAIMEHTDLDEWTREDYQTLVQLKNVDYWRALYAAVDPECASPLYPFLESYYELAQYLNDVEDHEDDLRWEQPNLIEIYRRHGGANGSCLPIDGSARKQVPAEVAELISDRFEALAEMASDLPPTERDIARTKLADSLHAARDAGLFITESDPEPSPTPEAAKLYWYSEITDVIEQAGSQHLEDVACAVCGSTERTDLFRKQGFSYRRCTDCTHVYVSPRITVDLQGRMLAELDELSFEDKYLEVQRMYAETTCDELRRRSSGSRLLDIGFGRGYLMQMAQAYGFDVHGVDSSQAQVERLGPQFGNRVSQCFVGRDPLPWTEMDVVVMSHVLEHIADPGEALSEVRGIMNGEASIYVAVPDMESMDFKIFGKNWDVVNPLVHLQYFTEASLTRLLEANDFEDIERVHHPKLRDEISPRWMRLMRHLGGDELGELAMIGRVPGGSP